MKLRGASKTTLLIGFLLSLLTTNVEAAPVKGLAVTPGEIVIDPPTLINLGFEWPQRKKHSRDQKLGLNRFRHRQLRDRFPEK